MNKEIYNKPFAKQYKEIKGATFIIIFGGLLLILSGTIHIINDGSDWLSSTVFVLGGFFILYGPLYFFLYWKFSQYIKNNQFIPKWFKIVAIISFNFYLIFYQSDTKKYRNYLLFKKIRFYFFLILFSTLFFIPGFWFIKNNIWFWFSISTYILFIIIFIIGLTTAILICKYQGKNKKWLKNLAIITSNYYLYKEIIELNTNEKADNY